MNTTVHEKNVVEYTVDEEANDKTTKSFQGKGGSTPSVCTVKEERLHVLLYYPQVVTMPDRDIKGVKRTVCKGGAIALENGNPLVRVIVEGWHEAIGKQKATDCNEEDVLDPYFLAHVSVKDSN